jgi:hypothetical protein
MDETPAAAAVAAPGALGEHGTRLRNNALNLLGYARATGSGYFATPREVFQPGAGPVPASQVPERQPTD